MSVNSVLLFPFQVKAYLRSHHISKELRQRIDNWYQHLHINKKIMRENEILQQLPVHLRTEIAVSVHLPTLSKVTIFQSCEKSLLEELVLKLTPQVRRKKRWQSKGVKDLRRALGLSNVVCDVEPERGSM